MQLIPISKPAAPWTDTPGESDQLCFLPPRSDLVNNSRFPDRIVMQAKRFAMNHSGRFDGIYRTGISVFPGGRRVCTEPNQPEKMVGSKAYNIPQYETKCTALSLER